MFAETTSSILEPTVAFFVAVFAAMAGVVGFFKLLRELRKLRLENELLMQSIQNSKAKIITPTAQDVEEALKLRAISGNRLAMRSKGSGWQLLSLFLFLIPGGSIVISLTLRRSEAEDLLAAAQTTEAKYVASLIEARRELKGMAHELSVVSQNSNRVAVAGAGDFTFPIGPTPSDEMSGGGERLLVDILIKTVDNRLELTVLAMRTRNRERNERFERRIFYRAPNQRKIKPLSYPENYARYEWTDNEQLAFMRFVEGNSELVRRVRVLDYDGLTPRIAVELNHVDIVLRD